MNEQTSERWAVGDQADSRTFDTTTVDGSIVELIHGEHPHSRNDNSVYARNPVTGTVHEFDGHRRLIDITIKSSNYLKESDFSGDQIRKSVVGAIISDGTQVYEFSHRTVEAVLLQAHRLLQVLQEHESGWLSADERMRLPGRKIYYHEMPATIQYVIEDQGCVIISIARDAMNTRVRGQEIAELWEDWLDADGDYVVKDDVLSPHIWWWRDDEVSE
jgi:hypothetical protein